MSSIFRPEQASTFAPVVDEISFWLAMMTSFFVIVIALVILIFIVKYRRSKRPTTPEKTRSIIRLEIAWLFIPLIVGLFFFAWGARAYLDMYSVGPSESYEVYVTGKQWMWKFQHPTGQRENNELHVPIHTPVRLIMISQDVIHSFYVPAFRVKHDVLPMIYTMAWFQAIKEGVYDLFCAEYCGTDHSRMGGKVMVLNQSKFEEWLAGGQTQGSIADQGQALLQSFGCRSCHMETGTAIAPRLEGIFGKTVQLSDGTTVTVDENYIRESILNPNAKVVLNYNPVMPSYAGRITEEQIMQIIAYIKSVGDQP